MWSLVLAFMMRLAFAGDSEFKFVLHAHYPGPDITERATLAHSRLSSGARAELLRFEAPLRDVLTQMQAEQGAVACDCGVFVQIQAHLERSAAGPAVLLTPEGNSAGWIACSCERELAYLRPKNLLAFQILQNSSFSGKGHWLLPMGDGRYTGILREGAVTGTAAEWKAWAAEVLDSEVSEKSACEEALIRDSALWTELQFMRVLRKSGQLEEWDITGIPPDGLSAEQRRALRRILASPALPKPVQ